MYLLTFRGLTSYCKQRFTLSLIVRPLKDTNNNNKIYLKHFLTQHHRFSFYRSNCDYLNSSQNEYLNAENCFWTSWHHLFNFSIHLIYNITTLLNEEKIDTNCWNHCNFVELFVYVQNRDYSIKLNQKTTKLYYSPTPAVNLNPDQTALT